MHTSTKELNASRLKVGVVGLFSNKNIGDYLLVETAKYLVFQERPDAQIRDIDVDPRNYKVYTGVRRLNLALFNVMKRGSRLAHAILLAPHLRYLYSYLMWWLKLNWWYRSIIKDLDCLVIAGGGFLKFQTQGLNYLVEQIVKIAQQRGIPVMFNAVGIEGYDHSDIRCRNLERAINSEVVKTITTRDDIEILNGKYKKNDNITTALVGDPALWIPECFSMKRGSGNGPIGINLINPNNFRTYGGSIDSFSVLNFFENLIQELELRGVDYVLFTNGMEVDQRFGSLLVRRMNLPRSKLLPRPLDSSELLRMVSGFRSILSARMHSGIVAHALQVPKAGLIWGEKLEFFSTLVGERETYFDENELDHARIANLLCDAAPQSLYTVEKTEELRNETVKYLRAFLESVEEGSKNRV